MFVPAVRALAFTLHNRPRVLELFLGLLLFVFIVEPGDPLAVTNLSFEQRSLAF